MPLCLFIQNKMPWFLCSMIWYSFLSKSSKDKDVDGDKEESPKLKTFDQGMFDE